MNFQPYTITDNRLTLTDWRAVRRMKDWPRSAIRCPQCFTVYPSDYDASCCDCGFDVDKMEVEHRRPHVVIHEDLFAVWDGPVYDTNGKKLATTSGGIRSAHDIDTPDYTLRCNQRWLLKSDIVSDVLALIDECPNVDFVLRTDEPGRVREVWPQWPKLTEPQLNALGSEGLRDYREGRRISRRDNVLLLANITTQSEADSRIPDLLGLSDLCKVGAWAVGAVEELDLRPCLEDYGECEFCGYVKPSFEPDGIGTTAVCPSCFTSWEDAGTTYTADNSPLSTVFVGGEHSECITSQCRDAGVPVELWEAGE